MAKRVDKNQSKIVKELRDFGAVVQDLHEVGRGCPDILVSFRGVNYLFEIKSFGEKLSDNEREMEWHSKWLGPVTVVYTAEQAINYMLEKGED